MQLTARPISTWPGERSKSHWDSPFRSTWTQTEELLERELFNLGARNVVLELEVTESEIRLDGWIRATARPAGPGVILSFESRKFGPLRYPCDRFRAWQENVRAIALALEALRKVDRYGVTKHGEQYRGWKALPPAGATTLTVSAAARLIAEHAGDEGWTETILDDPDFAKSMIREAQKVTHPDVAGGSGDAFQLVQTAKALLEGHHK